MSICGPSKSETNLANSEASFSSLLMSNYAQNFGNQSAILNHLSDIFTPIAEAGPGQQGFTPAELSALNSGAISTNAANYKSAAQVVGDARGAAGGGNDYLPSGADKQVQAQLASNEAANLSNTENQITAANYATGRANWEFATGGLGGVAQQENPTAIAGESTNANQSAFGEANTVQQEVNQEAADIGSMAGGMLAGGINAAPGQSFVGGMLGAA